MTKYDRNYCPTALGVDDATAEELLSKCVKDGY